MVVHYSDIVAAEFGSGDILISATSDYDNNGWMFFTNIKEPFPVGTNLGIALDGLEWDKIKERAQLMMTFSNVESLTVVIKQLEALKKDMLEDEKECEVKDEILD